MNRFNLRSLVGSFAVLLMAGAFPVRGLAEEKASGNLNRESAHAPIGLQGVELSEWESDFEPQIKRFILPPYYQEIAGPLTTRFFFPLCFFRKREGLGANSDLGILPFYWRHRSAEENADVYFPLYWRFRGSDYKTDIALQTYYNRSQHGYNFGLGPLFFFGKDARDNSSYQIVPPLFWRLRKGASSFLLAGIYYDRRKGENFDLGLPPLFFAGRERFKTYFVAAPPLFWRFTDEIAYTTKNVLPPFFYNTREHGVSFGLVPLLYFARDRNWDRTLITPFYYGSRWPLLDKQGAVLGEGKSYYFPLLLSYYRHAPGLSQGGAAFFYHWYWYEGDYFKMFSPLLWFLGNERTSDHSILIPPLFFHRGSPVRDDLMAGLVYWNFHEFHQERTVSVAPLFAVNRSLYEPRWRAWVAPTFDFGKQPHGYHVRMHPLFYLGKKERSSHFVLAPLIWRFRDEEDDDFVLFPFLWLFDDLEHNDSTDIFFPFWWQLNNRYRQTMKRIAFPLYWDFHDRRESERTILVFPLFWRDRDRQSAMTGVLNFIWHSGAVKGNPYWTFKVFPFLDLGHPPAPEGAYWSFLSGLVGWRRQGHSKELKLFWIPFDLSDN